MYTFEYQTQGKCVVRTNLQRSLQTQKYTREKSFCGTQHLLTLAITLSKEKSHLSKFQYPRWPDHLCVVNVFASAPLHFLPPQNKNSGTCRN